MRIILYSARQYDRQYFQFYAEQAGFELTFVESRMSAETMSLANGFDVVCGFVNDRFDEQVVQNLKKSGVQLIALRCAGFNNCDVHAAKKLNLPVVRVPRYSPYSVAEHTFALILAVIRKTHRAYNRVREGNYELNGLLGFDLHGKTIGLIGTGNIGEATARIAHGFGMRVLVYDPHPNTEIESFAEYLPFEDLANQVDILSLHCPLIPATQHLIDASVLQKVKPGLVLINTSRGGLIDTSAVIQSLKQGTLGGLGIDVYENESSLFFEDRSSSILHDDLFARLLTFPNVIVTGHQGFFTKEALEKIASTTIGSVRELAAEKPLTNQIEIHE